MKLLLAYSQSKLRALALKFNAVVKLVDGRLSYFRRTQAVLTAKRSKLFNIRGRSRKPKRNVSFFAPSFIQDVQHIATLAKAIVEHYF